MHLSACASMSVSECVCVYVSGPEEVPGCNGGLRMDIIEYRDGSGDVNIISIIGI